MVEAVFLCRAIEIFRHRVSLRETAKTTRQWDIQMPARVDPRHIIRLPRVASKGLASESNRVRLDGFVRDLTGPRWNHAAAFPVSARIHCCAAVCQNSETP